MRQYNFQASEDTVELLRRLRGPWKGFRVSAKAFAVTLPDGSTVSVRVGAADVEDLFEAFRLEATAEPIGDTLIGVPMEAAGDFAAGGNDLVLFTGAAWSVPMAPPVADEASSLAPGQSMHFSGHPGQVPEQAEVVILTTDGIVVASKAGSGVLVRTGLAPYSIDVVYEREAIAKFLQERGYAEG